MALIEMKGIAHSYVPNPAAETDYALRRADMTWRDGGAFSLLGPSGCGKSTLLNILSGLLRPSEGKILFNGKDVTNLTTQERNIAQVFQFPVIYDTMTVFDNLAFPLRNRKLPKTQVVKRVEEVAEMLELSADLKKRAAGLTPDIKQIISLGRGLVRSDVTAILFDEPLTVIDPHVKWLLRRRLKQIHDQFKLTMIFVTHDQNEALTFADLVVVMNQGAVLQQGTPQELFEKPAHSFVGYFIGSPGMNLLPCRIEGRHAVIEDRRIPVSPGCAQKAAHAAGEIKLGIRPAYGQWSPENIPGSFSAFIQRVENLGDYQLISARLGKHLIKVTESMEKTIPVGCDSFLRFPEEHTFLYANENIIQ